MCWVKVKSIEKWRVCEYFSDRLWLNCNGEFCDQLVAVFLWGLIVLLIKMVINGLIVEHCNIVNILYQVTHRQNKINWLKWTERLSVWKYGIRVHLVGIFFLESRYQNRPKARAGSTSNWMEHLKTLEAVAFLYKLSNVFKRLLDNKGASSVMTLTPISIWALFPRNKWARIKLLIVWVWLDFINELWV